ncbi:PIN domain-containing protein [uncultured Parolsenella sp.]|uniref:PIN domain-containing protein n=1 Tax=uncultured Parolsenella sp. TaxID=2083008 RepID=UPI0027D95B2F|nr:PIN domain-containing protein [uncultured Parolsenella sp.]
MPGTPDAPVLLDANAVLRYLLDDIDDQASQVEAAIRSGAEVTPEVIAECVYVLGGVYGVSRSMIAESLGMLLDEVFCARGAVAASALGLYGAGSFDFVDCVLAAEHMVSGRKVLTFDKKLRKLLATCE